MDIEKAYKKAGELVKIYNLEGISPFPFDKIIEREKDLSMHYIDLPDPVSGAIVYDPESHNYSIYVNKNKHPNRQHFTAAHELGHFFLHKNIIKQEETIIDNSDNVGGDSALYRLDHAVLTDIEKEANNFAASLIMPEELVIGAWESIKDVEECAKIFNVSISAMSIRLDRLNLIN